MHGLLCDRCGAPARPGSSSCHYCGVSFKGAAAPGLQDDRTAPGVMREIEASLRRGHKINAIRIYREHHKSGLKEAKDAIEALEERLRR